ncbi:MAG: mechanosensitive ion channel family protein [Fidelibacterota bacterium]|nr:MAG: mechanosensitive ion channel family protein [Candidatus Neomarinimicrobiota bacterium]
MNFWEQLNAAVDWTAALSAGLRILVILLLTWCVTRFVRIALKRFQKRLIHKMGVQEGQINEQTKRTETLVRLLRQTITIALWLAAGLMILRELGINIAPLLAGAGIVGLALGFGAQNLVRDLIAGFFMIIENQVRVNDAVIINGTSGIVDKINLRTIVLRDLGGVVHVFPNGSVNTLSNMSKEWSAYVFEIGVAYKEDTDRVVEILKRVGEQLRADEEYGPLIQENIEVLGVDQLADSAVVIKGRIITQPVKQWFVGREFLRRVKKTFDAEGVEIPFPHRSIYFGEASLPALAELVNAGSPGTGGKHRRD